MLSTRRRVKKKMMIIVYWPWNDFPYDVEEWLWRNDLSRRRWVGGWAAGLEETVLFVAVGVTAQRHQHLPQLFSHDGLPLWVTVARDKTVLSTRLGLVAFLLFLGLSQLVFQGGQLFQYTAKLLDVPVKRQRISTSTWHFFLALLTPRIVELHS